jgi:maltooligosyltrehalose trehalohydrolase
LGIILDVVYNHFGPDGNYLTKFSPYYFTSRRTTDWGEAINYDGEHSGPVREYIAGNAAYWIDEYHFDGLRLDATDNIYDDSPDHILRLIGESVRSAAKGRSTVVVAENEVQETRIIRPVERGGWGLDALWNDDFHHSAFVALTGRNEAYYTDYLGRPQEFISAAKYGFLYQGQWYSWKQKRRGTPALDLPAERFITFIENHDQVANSAHGERLVGLVAPAQLRAMTALLLLGPGTPMLFQGQEYGSTRKFCFFTDQKPELAPLVCEGRRQFMSQFRSIRAGGDVLLSDPGDPQTFERCKLDFAERECNAPIYRLHKDLLRIRREEIAFDARHRTGIDGAVLGELAFALRFFVASAKQKRASSKEDRLLLVNLGMDLRLDPAPEPLLAPPEDCGWEIAWSSEDPSYGGSGTPPVETRVNWRLPGHAAVLLRPGTRDDLPTIPLIQEDVS